MSKQKHNEIPRNMKPQHAASYAQLSAHKAQREMEFYYRGQLILVCPNVPLSDIVPLFEAAGGGQ